MSTTLSYIKATIDRREQELERALATNAACSNGASASIDSITPEALPTGLPVWLLHEATK